MIFYSTVTIKFRGQDYNGRFSVEDGLVCVDAAYGSARCAVAKDPEKAKKQAEALLRQIVLERYG